MVFAVYCDPCTVNSRKVLAGCKLLGTEYDFHHVDYFKGEQKSEEYKKINPSATVPAATDGDLRIIESNAILQYAADSQHGGAHPAYPANLRVRSRINSWLLWEASAWFPSCYIWLVEYVVKPLLKAEPDQAVIDGASARFHQLAGILDAQLQQTKWLAGDEVTIADIAVAAPMHLHEAQRLPLDQHQYLKRWLAEVEKLPCWIETQDAVDTALLPNKKPANGTTAAAAAGAATTASNGDAHSAGVEANFNYTKDLGDKLTELYFYETEKAQGIHEPGDDPHTMLVRDGWGLGADNFTADKNGFSVHDFPTAYDGWEDDEAVKAQFYPEVVAFLKQTVGAARVLVFDHTIRTKNNSGKKLTQETNTSQRAPVTLVHCDYTAESGPARVKQLLPDEAETLLGRRVAFFNVWKPIRRVVEESPLAMCDVTSAPSADFFKLHLRYRDRDGENYVMRHAPGHQWWYFPKMTPQQAILLKTYDSETDGRARFVGHSAFEDPTSAKDAPTRESVEIRTICFY